MRARRPLVPVGVSLLAAFVPSACSSEPYLPPELVRHLERNQPQDWHRGPDVDLVDTGPARFVSPLYEAFDPDRAMKTLRFADGFYRAPGNEGFDAVLDHVAGELASIGFASGDPRLDLEFLETPLEEPAWTPRSARVVLHPPGEAGRVLHEFDEPGDVDRVMLPVNTPSCTVEGIVTMHLEGIRQGSVLVTDVPAMQVMQRAEKRGAVAVVSASLASYNVDPSGAERHLDAIQFRNLPASPPLPVIQISPRSFSEIELAVQRVEGSTRSVRLEIEAKVDQAERPLRTLVATLRGSDSPDECIVMGSHVQEPGACDNASGVAGLLESARALVQLLEEGELPWPKRSLVFVWGDEFDQTQAFLDSTKMKVVAGISSDMTGQSKETGAIALLERMPDPGALSPLPPDQHSLWGAGQVEREDLRPNGLAVVARCAMVDVGALEGGWTSADHPWEGGSDHDIFIRRGIPAVLFWHFTDFTYHTSLDRIPFVDPGEIRRMGVALLSTACALADPDPTDLERYLNSLQSEERVRVEAAEKAGDAELVELWHEWCRGARGWLRNHCLGIDEPLPAVRESGSEEKGNDR